MSKQVFWPAVLVVMGLVLMAANMGYLPMEFRPLWPLLMIIIGLGGVLTADRPEWIVKETTKKTTAASKSVKPAARRRK
jgi:hypothetical protein